MADHEKVNKNTVAQNEAQDLADKPRVLILPPDSVIETELMRRLSFGLIEDITVGLARYRSFSVFSPHTGQSLSAMGMSAADASPVIKFDYLINAIIKPRGNADFSLSFRLTQFSSKQVLWAAEYPLNISTTTKIFGSMVSNILQSLASEIERSELSQPATTEDVSAYRMFLEGTQILKRHDLPSIRRSRKWFSAAARRTESFAPSFVGISRTLSLEWLVCARTDGNLLDEALKNAKKASEIDGFDGRGVRQQGFVNLYQKCHDECLEMFDQAIALIPNDADCLADYADALAHSGKPIDAHKKMLKAIELNPLNPDFYDWIFASIYFQLENYQEAIRILQNVKDNPASARILAASHAMLGEHEQARFYSQVVRESYPGFTTMMLHQIIPNRHKSDTDRIIDGLRAAGLP